jgi:two-component system osmolarity sensor histidine kinase EnvZ
MKRPFKLFKKWLPRTLFARTLMIVIAPLLVVQLISAYIFFERHWDDITRRLANTTAGQIAVALEMLEQPTSKKLKRLAIEHFDLSINQHPGKALQDDDHGQINTKRFERDSILRTMFKRDFWEIFLIEALQRHVTVPFHVHVKRHVISIEVQTKQGITVFQVQRRHVFTGSTLIFMMWSLGTMILFMGIAIAFLRNQIRPIRNLSEAAEKFGKGQVMTTFKPSGAIEVRKASIAFLMMRERILRQIKQHTQMLAGVSHDLRTPLTRMKLQMALMKQDDATLALAEDVSEMESMIEAYLTFAKSGDYGDFEQINLVSFMQELALKIILPPHHIHWPEEILPVEIYGWGPALKRAFTNILQNAQKFAKNIWVSWIVHERHISLFIDDDGPGVPSDSIADIFKPFYRVEGSRNRQTGGIGLGLAIARNIARSHGGDVSATPSPHGGLRITLTLKRDPR